MKKSTALFLALALPAVVVAAPPDGRGPQRDSVVGGGKSISDIFNVAAHSGPNGQGAFGHVQARNVPGYDYVFDVEFEVTCLRVVGDMATIGGRTTKLIAPPEFGYSIDVHIGVIQYVRDGRSTGTPDVISFQFPITSIPATCPAPNAAALDFPLLQGNINVTDE